MQPVVDLSLWEKIKTTFVPLKKKHQKRDMPQRLTVKKVPANQISTTLDLHHKTVQDAYLETTDFISKHYNRGTRKIQIITGKGCEGRGAIRSEFFGWLETPTLQRYVLSSEWTKDKGAVNLCLKKRK